jgi:hypothetical protein
MPADYATLQKQALASNGQDEAVTVNQRALIGISQHFNHFPNM